jgi:hypothetical protein
MSEEIKNSSEKPVNEIPGRNGGTLRPGYHGQKGGHPKGQKNRSTLLKKWAEAVSDKKNPITGEVEKMSQEDIAALALIFKAQKGDVPAFKEMMDTLYGKLQDNINLMSEIDLSGHIKIEVGFDAPDTSGDNQEQTE